MPTGPKVTPHRQEVVPSARSSRVEPTGLDRVARALGEEKASRRSIAALGSAVFAGLMQLGGTRLLGNTATAQTPSPEAQSRITFPPIHISPDVAPIALPSADGTPTVREVPEEEACGLDDSVDVETYHGPTPSEEFVDTHQ